MDPQMYKAASNGESSFFDNLTASDSTLLQVTIEKNTVLHIGVQFEQYEVAKKIVCLLGCLAMQTNSKGNTPLHVAAKVGDHDMVRFLIEHAEDRDVETGVRQLPRMVNLERDTALHIAVKYGNFEVVKELIKEDSKLAMYVNKAGESALFLAVDRQFYEIASLILSATQDTECSCAGRHGMNVLHALVIQTSDYFNEQMSEISSLESIETNCDPQRSFGTIQEDFVRKVVEKFPFTIKQGDDSGWTPLHIAAHMGNKNYVELLLANGNSPAYIKNNEGLSALHIAAKKGNIDVIEELIKTSPDIYELLDNKGQTALHAAAAAKSEKYEVVSFFLNIPGFKGLINEQDKEGNTPINLAAIKRHKKVISLLKKCEGLDLNAKNKEGFTRLDHILLQNDLSQFEQFRNDIIKIQMRMEGAQPSLMGVLLKLGIREAGDGKGMARSDSVKEENQNNLLVDGKGMARPDSVKEENQTNLLVATLIATVTFTAAFTVPGGYQNQGVDEGLAVLSKRASFRAFLITNTLAFAFSMTSILIHFFASHWSGVPFREKAVGRSSACTFYAMIALPAAFISGTYTVVPHPLGLTVAVILVLPFSLGASWLMYKVLVLLLIRLERYYKFYREVMREFREEWD